MHLMYVDESGDCGYPEGDSFPATGGPTRYFVRGGLILHGWKWMQIHQMDAEIKAVDLRRGKGAFKGWPRADRRQLLNDLLDSIGREIDIHVLVVAINKELVDRSQRPRFTNPAVRSLELLLERYNAFLAQQRDKSGMVILDEVESKSDENLRYFQSYLTELLQSHRTATDRGGDAFHAFPHE